MSNKDEFTKNLVDEILDYSEDYLESSTISALVFLNIFENYKMAAFKEGHIVGPSESDFLTHIRKIADYQPNPEEVKN